MFHGSIRSGNTWQELLFFKALRAFAKTRRLADRRWAGSDVHAVQRIGLILLLTIESVNAQMIGVAALGRDPNSDA
jgi:hypothetical protein